MRLLQVSGTDSSVTVLSRTDDCRRDLAEALATPICD